MARQRPTRLVMGPCIVEIDRIVIREVQYQLEVNRCRNEEMIVKVNFGWAWPMWAGRHRIGNGAIHKVQYQFEVNRCRNEEIIVKGNLDGRGLFGRGAPGLVMGPCIVKNDCIVIKEVQYQFEVNQCRNEEIIKKCNFGWAVGNGPCNFGWAWPMWAWPMWGGCPRIDCIYIREVQYQFEVNRCRNEEKGNFGGAWPMWAGRPRIANGAMHMVQYQFEDKLCRNEEIIETDGRKTEITTISPLFLRKAWG
ncbi:hypothetical protein DPMN_154927 [Dreissena polymorpha]|uniref:Uncharacterized protein n=1 Tax=Dreissena polymorpha TaxID=45954 RepID=A0A9D4FLE7_DREPO|nr:hypothetical protein DPMN_154927 [Dreissena polymorpha]